MKKRQSASGAADKARESRDARLKRALKANIARRKAQAAARNGQGGHDA